MNLNDYEQFVSVLTSGPSKDLAQLIDRFGELNADVCRLMTSSIGLASESGEYSEIVKKVMFQGKPLNQDTYFHLKRELGDILFYWTMACTAIGCTPQEVLAENVSKLSARYPGGFTIKDSENRAEGDL